MPVDVREARFEDALEIGLKATGYRALKPGGEGLYDKVQCLMPSVVLDFPRSFKTRAVIPTLVAVSVPPTNRCVSQLASGRSWSETIYPSTIGRSIVPQTI